MHGVAIIAVLVVLGFAALAKIAINRQLKPQADNDRQYQKRTRYSGRLSRRFSRR